MTAIERVMQEVQNDPSMAPRARMENQEATAIAPHTCSLPPAEEISAVVVLPAPSNAVKVVPRPEAKQARRLPFAARLLGAIFQRPRMAA
jgi:hypothetical protein